jgi:hypothetical protein
MTEYLPYGTWPSPIPPELLVAGVARPTDVQVAEGATSGCIGSTRRTPMEGCRARRFR